MTVENTKVGELLDVSQSSFADDQLRLWLVIIGIVTVVLLLLLFCIQCILKVRNLYRDTDDNGQRLTTRQSHSDRRPLGHDQHCKCTCYPNFQCIKSTEYVNYRLIDNKDCRISLPSVHHC